LKVLIAGAAGQMARPVIKHLSSLALVSGLTLADISAQRLRTIIEQDKSGKCRPFTLDVRNEQQLLQALQGQDVVVNLVGPYYLFGTTVLEAAIQKGVNYVDIVDDFDTAAQLLELNDKAAGAGVTALIAMGASPGVINVLSRLSSEQMEQTEEINTYWVAGEPATEFTGALRHFFHAVGSKVPTFKNGQMILIRPFKNSEAQVITFPPPLGEFQVYQMGHPEPVTLPRFIPGVKTVTNRGALYPAVLNHIFKVLVNYGFTSEEPIPFRGEMVAPLEFFEALFNARQKEMPSTDEPPVMGMGVEVKGKKDNREIVHWYTHSANCGMAEATGYPLAVGVEMILAKEITSKGVIAPECLEPGLFLRRLGAVTTVYDQVLLSEKIGGAVKREGKLFDEKTWGDLLEGPGKF
jgi:saccharopine dehydrogenase (NAD+, L-lysine-forming)